MGKREEIRVGDSWFFSSEFCGLFPPSLSKTLIAEQFAAAITYNYY